MQLDVHTCECHHNYDANRQLGIPAQSEICQPNIPEFRNLRDNPKPEQVFKASTTGTLREFFLDVGALNLAYYFTCFLLTLLLQTVSKTISKNPLSKDGSSEIIHQFQVGLALS